MDKFEEVLFENNIMVEGLAGTLLFKTLPFSKMLKNNKTPLKKMNKHKYDDTCQKYLNDYAEPLQKYIESKFSRYLKYGWISDDDGFVDFDIYHNTLHMNTFYVYDYTNKLIPILQSYKPFSQSFILDDSDDCYIIGILNGNIVMYGAGYSDLHGTLVKTGQVCCTSQLKILYTKDDSSVTGVSVSDVFNMLKFIKTNNIVSYKEYIIINPNNDITDENNIIDDILDNDDEEVRMSKLIGCEYKIHNKKVYLYTKSNIKKYDK